MPAVALPSWLHRPAWHFALLGMALFVASGGWRAAAPARGGAGPAASASVPAPGPERAAIVFAADRVARLAGDFLVAYGREPTPAELAAFVDRAVDDELLEREARRLDLGAGDPAIRRRLVQKMRAVSGDPGRPEDELHREALRLGLDDDLVIRRLLREKLRLALRSDPADAVVSDADVRAYVARHRDRFERPGAVAFAHVFFSTHGDGRQARAEAEAALRELSTRRLQPPASDDLSDAFPLGLAFRARPEDALAAQFGEGFAGRVLAAPPRKWVGPIASVYGLHLVWVEARMPGELPPLEQLRPRATRELQDERADARLVLALQRLRAAYDVRVELPGAGVRAPAAPEAR